ncbi:MAG: hypothetical protein NTZ78_14795 [Candidatus Aureabacteria bacterium]|nr:hypothetical protein [Candidatus Auribacterota bacterium]
MRAFPIVFASVMVAAGVCGTAVAGSLDSPGAPSAGSGMYTVQNLYDYIVSGTALTVQSGFQEPASGPGSTMKTTKEIGDDIKALFDLCPVMAANVESGVRFFCTQPGSWGIQTGTAQLVPTPTPTLTPTLTPTPTITPIPWNETTCESATYNGYWGAKNDGTSDNGCWFYASGPNFTCTEICQSHNLSCASGSWNDDSTCEIASHIVTQPHGCCTWATPETANPAWCASNQYVYVGDGNSNICDEKAGDRWRMCVCLP